MSNKTWKFVLNNWTPKDREFFENLDCNYIVFGEEDEGTPHLQGGVIFKRCYRLTALKKLHHQTHWEIAKCKDFNYEMKGENIFIKDNRQQGKRTDLDDIVELIENGGTKADIVNNHPKSYIKYHCGIEKLLEAKNIVKCEASYSLLECSQHIELAPLTFGVTRILVGPAGCGKSQFALAHFDNPLLVSHVDDLKKFNDHDGIVFDDIDFNHIPRTAQIHLVDWDFDRSIHCRYGNAIIPKHTPKIFTCNIDCIPVKITDSAINRRIIITYLKP